MSVSDLFDKHDEEFLKFERVANKQASRSDVHAFVLLDRLFPGQTDLLCSAEHDQVWLGISTEEISKLTEEQVIELLRCGVTYDNETDSLTTYV